MKKTIIVLILSLFITVLAAACGEQEIALSDVTSREETMAENDETVPVGEAEGTTDAAAGDADAVSVDADTAQNPGTVYVYVCGEVVMPGVYELAEGARIYEAVTLAGGLTDDADPSVINQAETVTDGMMIRIPAVGSTAAQVQETLMTGQVTAADGTTLVNINTADTAALMTLPGIGESKAAAIIAWRQENGGFKDTQDIKNVSGIGDSTYERLAPLITVTP